ncbi:MAG: helix-turn-helix domain-containing protein, partial [Geodermatophilaceae bacterium]|nr:helix-turn-helix domain-containing protein [Geodermatophilaceae bacterium]
MRHTCVVKSAATVPERTIDVRTRDRVTRFLLERGPLTAAALATLLGVSPAGVRRHLDALLAEGRVDERDSAAQANR